VSPREVRELPGICRECGAPLTSRPLHWSWCPMFVDVTVVEAPPAPRVEVPRAELRATLDALPRPCALPPDGSARAVTGGDTRHADGALSLESASS